jgi:hypothetical protein
VAVSVRNGFHIFKLVSDFLPVVMRSQRRIQGFSKIVLGVHLYRHGKCDKSEVSLPISLPLSFAWKKVIQCAYSTPRSLHGSSASAVTLSATAKSHHLKAIAHVPADSGAVPKG